MNRIISNDTCRRRDLVEYTDSLEVQPNTHHIKGVTS